MKKMEQIIPAPPGSKGLVRVAAYARISMVSERTPVSLSTQVSYYQKLITTTPGWQYVGVFADSGITGTTTRRPQFQELLALARDRQVDLILTKSISRFSRNTVDLLKTVRELKDLGVEVRFEKEGISSLTADGELMLTLLASFAQAESEQISQNVKWRVAKQFEQGLANGFHHYGYTDSADGTDVEIIEEEAEVVRRIYRMYLEQISCERMADIFEAEGIVARSGEPIDAQVLRSWLKAETFTGTLTLGKHFSPGLGRHSQLNKGEKPMYRVENAVPAIISRDLFDEVQAERARRREQGAHANWSIPTSCLTSVVKCGVCGRSYSRSGKRSTTGERYSVWSCRTKRDGKKRTGGRTCDSKDIPESTLHEHLAPLLGLETFDPDAFTKQVKQVIMQPGQVIEVIYRDGSTKTAPWHSDRRARAWTPERREAWSKRHKALWADPEYREHLLAERAKKPRGRRTYTEESRAAMRAAWTPERREAVAEANRARWAKKTPEERHELGKRMQAGISEEGKKIKSEKLKASWTPERRAQASALMKKMRAEQKAAKEAQN